MQAYGVSDVERLLRLSRGTLNALVKAGFVTPTRGARNAWRFSFQDLIVLRTAQALVAEVLAERAVNDVLKRLQAFAAAREQRFTPLAFKVDACPIRVRLDRRHQVQAHLLDDLCDEIGDLLFSAHNSFLFTFQFLLSPSCSRPLFSSAVQPASSASE